jgi:hypothetical protein
MSRRSRPCITSYISVTDVPGALQTQALPLPNKTGEQLVSHPIGKDSLICLRSWPQARGRRANGHTHRRRANGHTHRRSYTRCAPSSLLWWQLSQNFLNLRVVVRVSSSSSDRHHQKFLDVLGKSLRRDEPQGSPHLRRGT